MAKKKDIRWWVANLVLQLTNAMVRFTAGILIMTCLMIFSVSLLFGKEAKELSKLVERVFPLFSIP